MPEPIKRHPSLVRFSREHHSGLMLVFKIRSGLKNSEELSALVSSAISSYNEELVPHFIDEEENLFPLLPEGDPMRIRAESDHQIIRNFISDMQKGNASLDLLYRFADLLESHIRFEERELFNRLQDTLSSEQLEKIGAVTRSSSCCTNKHR